ncbi:MAG: hypothetical protein ABI686_03025 [Acidobacteriota bacterium]
MKKAIYVLFGLFTFSVGFWLFNLYPFSAPVKLCEISQHVELYQSKQIRIEAYLYIAGFAEDNLSFYRVSDFENDCYATASLEISEKSKHSIENSKEFESFTELKQINNNLLEKDNRKGFYVARVEIVGEIQKKEESNLQPFVPIPPFLIKVDRVKQISPIRFVSYEEISKLNKQE